MVTFLLLVLLFVLPAVASVFGRTVDSRDRDYDLARLSDPRKASLPT